ncbi:DUF1127 domain-containing protein [Microvirga subterranea]|uniref:Uncharacterized protein YjiS (DUF1127 family) n=1 Tax=Microvirga subterranea TaxID=186651 RepID=A0A370HL38_9HYPH|nr:DUF1127 domain-containing protein [Microvirga subterranea]RDI58771.1 uncharacterized protein YjiS (DUF1127 family) [Microvirga subterranea]
MATAIATGNLGSFTTTRAPRKNTFLRFLLAFEAWQDGRANRRALYRMDDRALADIGLSRADVEGVNEAESLHLTPLLLLPDAGQQRV